MILGRFERSFRRGVRWCRNRGGWGWRWGWLWRWRGWLRISRLRRRGGGRLEKSCLIIPRKAKSTSTTSTTQTTVSSPTTVTTEAVESTWTTTPSSKSNPNPNSHPGSKLKNNTKSTCATCTKTYISKTHKTSLKTPQKMKKIYHFGTLTRPRSAKIH